MKAFKSFFFTVLLFVCAESMGQSVNITWPDENAKLKRGNTYELKWEGGSPDSTVRIELVNAKSGEAETIASSKNNGKYVWELGMKLKPGEYSIRVTMEGEQAAGSKPFVVRRRIPLAVKLLPIVPVAVVAFLVLTAEKELPPPPKPE